MKLVLNKYTKEVEDNLSRLSIVNQPNDLTKIQNYLGTKLKVHGIGAKTQHELSKTGYSFYSPEKVKNFEIFSALCFQSQSHEGMSQSYIYLDRNYKSVPESTQLEHLPFWVNTVDNWAHSDYLSKFLTRLFENPKYKTTLLDTVKKWNVSDNLWKRRQSLVSLYYYSRTKTHFLPYKTTSKLISNLLDDHEYYVQKAVGWALRESFNVYPTETYQFILKHVKHIKPAAFTTCLEKMTETEKQVLKQNRR